MNSLILFRHSDAEPSGHSDFERRLTDYGREKLAGIAEKAKVYLPRVTHILSSPYLRALESAAILADAYNVDRDQIVTHDEIATSLPRDIIRILKDYNGANTMLVGHMPTISYLAAELLSHRPLPIDLNFAPGHFLLMDFREKFLHGTGVLRAFHNSETAPARH